MLLIVWGRIRSQVLMVCVTCFWIGEVYLLLISACVLFLWVIQFFWIAPLFVHFFPQLELYQSSEAWTALHVHIAHMACFYCTRSHTAHFNFTYRLMCVHTPKNAFEDNILILYSSHLENSPWYCSLRKLSWVSLGIIMSLLAISHIFLLIVMWYKRGQNLLRDTAACVKYILLWVPMVS